MTLKVSTERWKQAQESERIFSNNNINTGDDWNQWWCNAFGGYHALRWIIFGNVIEVGCGPHTNIRFMNIPISSRIYLEDPLIDYYATHKPGILRESCTVKKLLQRGNVSLLSDPLEELPLKDESANLVVCINVLDHVRDFTLCMEEMYRVLDTNGVLVLGQDLTNADDLKRCPETVTDIGHPIKVNLEDITPYLRLYEPLMNRVLPREEGRNPRCHYGTYLGILKKL